ncbi:hypothetical protein [Rufibacter roseus]|uniref:Entericidin n=1 Tax=Rufibacter roseus TaxID=1567108 RepID=A0ABW2DGK6_9BACT|nr:hypothetical protein [Rufibacter roseus]
MKNTANFFAFLLLAAMFTLTSCGDQKPAETTGNTVTEDMVDGADGGLDSLDLSSESNNTSGADTVQL